MERAAGATEVVPDPVLLLRMGEEQVLLVAVLEPGEGCPEPDDDLLDASEPPLAQTGIDADAQWRQLNRILSSVINPRKPSLGRIFLPSSRLRATYVIGAS